MKRLTELLETITQKLAEAEADAILQEVVDGLADALDAKLVTLYTRNSQDRALYLSVQSTPSNGVKDPGKRLMPGGGLAGLVLEREEPVQIATAEEMAGLERACPIPTIAFPLRAFDDCLGVLKIMGLPEAVDEATRARIQPIVNLAAISIPRNEELYRLAEICVRFLEEKDPYTHGHSLRVMRYSLLLGEALGLPRKAMEEIRLCALLHDIGKVILKDSVLLKTGKLTHHEMEMVRLHTDIGSNITNKISPDLALMVRSHHERWDGEGYPQGLEGEEIPLVSRIIAICDTFDAITSKRPYRPSRTPEEAMSVILDQAGTQFDPDLVETVHELYEEGQFRLERGPRTPIS